MILFHHRAEIGCRGWNRTCIRAFKGRCPTIRRPGNWWPARVTRPVLRIKSPLHHFNACRPKNGARDRIRACTGDALDVVLLLWGQGIKPLAGLFHRLTPSAFKNLDKEMKGLGRSIYFAFRDSKWYARPVTLRNPALI